MMKMIVLRTSVKRKIMKAVMPVMASGLGTAVFMLCIPLFDRADANNEYTEIENMNSVDNVLFVPVETEQETIEEQLAPENADDPVTDVLVVSEAEQEPQLPGKYIQTLNLSTEKEDLTLFDRHSGAISEETFGAGNGPEYIDLGVGQLRNCTDISYDKVLSESGISSDISIGVGTQEPQVLILHTHATESYEPYIKDWYDERYTSRSFDPENSVIAVGEAIAEQLAAAGISVIHDCTLHDAVYNGSYTRSLETAVNTLAAYPSIKVVLDIHRDAIEYSDGTRVSAVTEIDGKKAAQVMMICAADDGNYDVPFFYENLHFACGLQRTIEGKYPTLTRPILFQYCQYNQQVSPGAMLIEVGSHGNSIDEAVYSGELIGRSLAEYLKENAAAQEPIAVPVMSGMPVYFLDRLR